jgi:hypothetical protein
LVPRNAFGRVLMSGKSISSVGRALLLVGVLSGCFSRSYDRDLVTAFELGGEHRWEEAREHARRYVLHNPDQAVGHYVWGQIHAHPTPQFTIAQGEFTTAQVLFAQNSDLGPLEGILTSGEFSAKLYRELAVLNMRWGYEAMELRAARPVIRRSFLKAFEHARAGLALDPESEYLGELVEALREMLEDVGA